MSTYAIQYGFDGPRAVFDLDADELRGIAAALGHHDAGAQEMLRAADELDAVDDTYCPEHRSAGLLDEEAGK